MSATDELASDTVHLYAKGPRTLCGLNTLSAKAWPFVSVNYVQRNVLDAGLLLCRDCARVLGTLP